VTEPLLVIADDDADMRTLVRSTLHDVLPDAIEVVDGRDLFWQLMRRSFETQVRDVVVIADVRMPAYNGLDVLDAWQDVEAEAPIVVITSFPDDEVRDRVKRLGGTLLAKPFTRAHLRAAVTAARSHR